MLDWHHYADAWKLRGEKGRHLSSLLLSHLPNWFKQAYNPPSVGVARRQALICAHVPAREQGGASEFGFDCCCRQGVGDYLCTYAKCSYLTGSIRATLSWRQLKGLLFFCISQRLINVPIVARYENRTHRRKAEHQAQTRRLPFANVSLTANILWLRL